MKALVHTAPYKLEYMDWEMPQLSPQDLLIRVRACAICGSDIKGYSGKTGRRQPPIIMGHEAAGEVVRTGSEVIGFAAGDRVGFDSTVYCLRCPNCLSGHFNLCLNRQVIGVSEGAYRRHGAMAEYVAVPYWIAVHLPDSLSYAQAALLETVSIGVHAANRTPLKLNDSVVIVGAGAIGLVTLQAVKLKGAGQVVVTDLSQGRLALASRLGADTVIPADAPELAQKLRQAVGAQGADACFEAVGIQATIATALAATRVGGSVTLIGNIAPSVEFALQTIVTGELNIYGVCASNGEYADCVELVAANRIQVDPLISAYARLEDGQAVFDQLYHNIGDNMRTVFIFD
ncbi:MAG: alcohol dehydrogenase catalytic domain-containing protein [Chloroflexi bacterium]|nr:alcohol dehydrogenase catalytic domain-containing protein [Chloroflexota bacterium]